MYVDYKIKDYWKLALGTSIALCFVGTILFTVVHMFYEPPKVMPKLSKLVDIEISPVDDARWMRMCNRVNYILSERTNQNNSVIYSSENNLMRIIFLTNRSMIMKSGCITIVIQHMSPLGTKPDITTIDVARKKDDKVINVTRIEGRVKVPQDIAGFICKLSEMALQY
jgi:hypothetical protein